MSENASATAMEIASQRDHVAQRRLEVPAGSDPLVGYIRKLFADTGCFRGSLASTENKPNRSREDSG